MRLRSSQNRPVPDSIVSDRAPFCTMVASALSRSPGSDARYV